MARHCPRTMAPPFPFGSGASLATKTPNIFLKSSLRTAWTIIAKAAGLGTAAFDSNQGQREESMSEGFTIANFRHVANGLQPGQFAVGERKKAVGLSELDPVYKQLLDQPVTMTLALIGPDGGRNLT